MNNCDICGGIIDTSKCYLLTTKQVVKSAFYWHMYYNMYKAELSDLNITSYDDLLDNTQIRATFSNKVYKNSSPWLACQSCVDMFIVNQEICFNYAQKWLTSNGKFVPPDSGPARLEDVDMGDGHVLYIGSEYVPTKRVDPVLCSICGHTLEYVGNPMAQRAGDKAISLDISFNAMELWGGAVCMTCNYIFCPSCCKISQPTPCPKCGELTQPAGRLQLAKIGIIESSAK